MNQNEWYLAHHGILGQKWGKKNGPPYPLDYKDLSSEERDKAKASAILRGDIKEANKNRQYFSNQEIQAVIDRFNMEAKLSSLNKAQIKSGMDKAKDVADKLGTMADIITKGSNAYNAAAKVANAFSDKELPIIGEKKDKESKPTKRVDYTYDNGKLTKEKTTISKGGNSTTTTKNYSTKSNNGGNSGNSGNNIDTDNIVTSILEELEKRK